MTLLERPAIAVAFACAHLWWALTTNDGRKHRYIDTDIGNGDGDWITVICTICTKLLSTWVHSLVFSAYVGLYSARARERVRYYCHFHRSICYIILLFFSFRFHCVGLKCAHLCSCCWKPFHFQLNATNCRFKPFKTLESLKYFCWFCLCFRFVFVFVCVSIVCFLFLARLPLMTLCNGLKPRLFVGARTRSQRFISLHKWVVHQIYI